MSKSNSDSIIQQITGQPHWELSYRPDTFVKDRIPLSECVNLVEKMKSIFVAGHFRMQGKTMQPGQQKNLLSVHG